MFTMIKQGEYGRVQVKKGRYAFQIGTYDDDAHDDFGNWVAIVWFGMPFRSKWAKIPYQDLVSRDYKGGSSSGNN